MPYQLDVNRLAVLVRTKRAGRSLRELAEEVGEVSPSTLSRLENGKTPDMMVFLRVCDWLQIPPAQLFLEDTGPPNAGGTADVSTPEPTVAVAIDVLIRSDKTLDAATANVLATIIKSTYCNLSIPPGGPVHRSEQA